MDELPWFPASLPPPLVDGYNESGDDGVLRSDFDGGTKTRPRVTGVPPTEVACVLACSQAQKQIIEDFYYVTVGRNGRFWWPDFTKPLNAQNVGVYSFSGRPTFSAKQPARFRASLPLLRHNRVSGVFLLDFYDETVWPTT
ncbi:hypothetical protein [Stenotrophomonas sp. MMGLT7]|uniref:hypothetical protein n=1 Tax=Stenotrophomonas sp. MMGLT7 TaxID=2901227 RepID=UPI001E36CD41|nr:hypothetical protein [Stenotrophomonas sp. MMGLT7]MCD7096933.1 hypothetical protein [Stenotrophomonas sp. MMGLT7]